MLSNSGTLCFYWVRDCFALVSTERLDQRACNDVMLFKTQTARGLPEPGRFVKENASFIIARDFKGT